MWSSNFLFTSFLLFMSLLMLISNKEWLVSWPLVTFMFSCDLAIVVDLLSSIFIIMVSVVSGMVLLYSNFYMKSSVFKKKFMISMIFFILSMVLLSTSVDLFWMMIGWDGLGLSSMYLIMYFQNWKSFNSSMVTFLSNRLGDVFIISSLGWLLSSPLPSKSSECFFFIFMLMIGALTKSAQIPFSSWLPLAMAAPTPVSSLVHSSTLVTAGVFVLIRFHKMFSNYFDFLFIISFLTILLAGSSSLGEYDLKKVIALSTLSHIGLMLMFVSMGMILSSLIHMVIHAFFKSLLFMVAGYIIHCNSNNQDIRLISVSSFNYSVGVSLIISLFSMMGMPFFSGFFSKEILLVSMLDFISFVKMISFFFSVMLTCWYSFRLLLYLLWNGSIMSMEDSLSFEWVIFFIMSIYSSIGGVMISLFIDWSLWFVPSLVSYDLKLFVLLILSSSVFLSWLLLSNFYHFGWGVSILQSMWWISSVNMVVQFIVLVSWKTLFKMDFKGVSDKVIILISSNKDEFSIMSSILVFNPMLLIVELCCFICVMIHLV
nr:NADH dehydrogenase subunit 5 [Pessoaiella absita]